MNAYKYTIYTRTFFTLRCMIFFFVFCLFVHYFFLLTNTSRTIDSVSNNHSMSLYCMSFHVLDTLVPLYWYLFASLPYNKIRSVSSSSLCCTSRSNQERIRSPIKVRIMFSTAGLQFVYISLMQCMQRRTYAKLPGPDAIQGRYMADHEHRAQWAASSLIGLRGRYG